MPAAGAFLLWFVAYVLGLVLFPLVPVRLIGWIITPFGTALTLWIAFRKVTGDSPRYFTLVGLAWLLVDVAGWRRTATSSLAHRTPPPTPRGQPR